MVDRSSSGRGMDRGRGRREDGRGDTPPPATRTPVVAAAAAAGALLAKGRRTGAWPAPTTWAVSTPPVAPDEIAVPSDGPVEGGGSVDGGRDEDDEDERRPDTDTDTDANPKDPPPTLLPLLALVTPSVLLS